MTVLGPDPALATFPVTRKRLAGLRDACEEAGHSWARTPVAVCATNSAALGRSAAADLLSGDPGVDALAAMSDELALGALAAAQAGEIEVPGALAVTGWDDNDAAAPAGLTTVRQDLREQGARCARLALGTTDDLGASEWEVVRRTTTRPDATGE